jgi:DNA-directed RNA polymerase specialized sigma24 family protein
MTQVTDDIIRILPGLRRYASAVTGSTRSGDEYIRVALAALMEEPWRLPTPSSVKPELYALLHRTLRACRFQDSDEPENLDRRADVWHRLRQLSLRDRELVLLVDLEGFAPYDAAELLGLSDTDAEWRLAGARRALRALQRDRAQPPPPLQSHEPRDRSPRRASDAKLYGQMMAR